LDNFWNGQVFDFALWRLTPEERRRLKVKVLPWRDGDGRILDDSVRLALMLEDKSFSAQVVSSEILTLSVQ
jgi:hypothetical protein